MFALAEIEDRVTIHPRFFRKSYHDAIISEIDSKYSNKILHRVGLCIVTHDLLHIGDAMIYPDDGSIHVNVKFRMVVFKPFVEEIVDGTIRAANKEEGLQVNLGFFNDLWISPDQLPEDSYFNEEEQTWVWRMEAGDAFMDPSGPIRVRIIHVEFNEVLPTQPAPLINTGFPPQTTPPPDVKQPPAMKLYGTIQMPGLGCPEWWH